MRQLEVTRRRRSGLGPSGGGAHSHSEVCWIHERTARRFAARRHTVTNLNLSQPYYRDHHACATRPANRRRKNSVEVIVSAERGLSSGGERRGLELRNC